MSIIHDALKKIQQGPSSSASPFTDPPPPDVEVLHPSGQQTAKQKPPAQTFKKILAFFCATAITVGSFWFLFHQLCTYIPTIDGLSKIWYYKLTGQKIGLNINTSHPPAPVPLAQITVNPPKPSNLIKPSPPLAPPVTAPMTNISLSPNPEAPATLNIHGVMSNGANNLVLIDNQVYQEGDDVDGVKIVKINLDYITVINNGKEEKIRVNN